MSGAAGRQRKFRVKKDESDQDEEDAAVEGEPEVVREKLVDTRLLQKFRRRPVGVDSASLAVRPDRIEEVVPPPSAEVQERQVLGTFSKAKAENAVVEEDPHMEKYVEEELARRLGKTKDEYEGMSPEEVKRRRIEKDLYSVPDNLKNNMHAEVVIPGMLTGITEVPLSAQERMHNIEEIEAMKRRMLAATGQGYVDEVQEAVDRQKEHGVRRGLFTSSFGKQQPKRCTLDAAGKKALRKAVVSEDASLKASLEKRPARR